MSGFRPLIIENGQRKQISDSGQELIVGNGVQRGTVGTLSVGTDSNTTTLAMGLHGGAVEIDGAITLVEQAHAGPECTLLVDSNGLVSRVLSTINKNFYIPIFSGSEIEVYGGWTKVGAIYWRPNDIMSPVSFVVDFETVLQTTSSLTAAYVRLYNETSGTAVSSTTLSTTSTAMATLTASDITLPGTNAHLEVQIKSASSGTAIICSMSRLLIKPE